MLFTFYVWQAVSGVEARRVVARPSIVWSALDCCITVTLRISVHNLCRPVLLRAWSAMTGLACHEISPGGVACRVRPIWACDVTMLFVYLSYNTCRDGTWVAVDGRRAYVYTLVWRAAYAFFGNA